jgi:hypothetical protein
MRTEAMAGLLVAAILVGAGVGYLFGSANMRTTTTTATSDVTTTLTVFSWSTITAPSLELIAKVSPPSITEGQNISIGAEVFNPLPTPFTILLIGAPCGRLPTSYQVYMGSNISGKPLLLDNASVIPPCFAAYNSTLTFQPNSDIVYDSSIIENFTHQVNYTDVLRGYWTPDGSLANGRTNYMFQEFPPGVYTIFFEDAWGQQQLEHFTVNP